MGMVTRPQFWRLYDYKMRGRCRSVKDTYCSARYRTAAVAQAPAAACPQGRGTLKIRLSLFQSYALRLGLRHSRGPMLWQSGRDYFSRSKLFCRICQSFKPFTFSIALVLMAISLVFLVG